MNDPTASHSSRYLVVRVALVVAMGLAIAPGTGRGQGCAGCVPLDDATGPPYLGQPLGLYDGATNAPPPAHLTLALQAAAQVVPRDAAGNPAADGFAGLVAIGMSNTNQEFAVCERQEDLRLDRNARLVIVDCAQGGQSADILVNRSASYWTLVDQRIAAAGLDPDQVQVAWLKEAERLGIPASFPASAETLQTHLRGIARHLKDRFPNLALCYLASRIYGGYGGSEPVSYEGGFAVRWLLAEQTGGAPALNPDPSAGPVEAPVLLWGPYLWANGATPRTSDGLAWLLADLESDHTHPSPSGEQKVADLLSGFLTSDATSAPWYLADAGEALVTLDAVADATVDDGQPSQNFGGATELSWSYPNVRSYVRFDLSAVMDSVVHAKLSSKTLANVQIGGVDVVEVTNTTWDEATITAANAPPFDGAVVGRIPGASRGTAVSLDVTSAVQAALAAGGGASLSLGLRALPSSTPVQQVGSRESADPSRLVLTTVRTATTATTPVARPALWLAAAPNPGGRRLAIRLGLGRDEPHAALAVFDARGRRVRTLLAGPAPAGEHVVVWDGRDDRGRDLPRGVYMSRARASGRETGLKVVLAP